MSEHGFKTKIKNFQKKFLPHRRIRARPSGLWFTGLLAAMGFLTLLSENNILFLLFSCQISVIILSGVLSEYSVSRLSFSRNLRSAYARENCNDVWVLRNDSRIPAFNVSVGEWINEEWVVHAVCRLIMPGETLSVVSRFQYSKRGIHRWDGIACGSDFPFGFSDKIRIDREPGDRIIWPERHEGSLHKLITDQLMSLGTQLREGELRNLGPGEVWADILRHRRNLDGTPLARSRGRDSLNLSFEINLDTISANELENSVRIVSALASRNRLEDLSIVHRKQKQIVRQQKRILDRVALIHREEAPWFAKNAS